MAAATPAVPDSPAWFQIVVSLPLAALEPVGAWLIEAGAAGLEQRDADHPQPPADLRPGWAELRASFGSGREAEPGQLLAGLEAELARISGSAAGWQPVIEQLDPEDWANSWRLHFSPVRVGRFYVHPGWVEPDPQVPWALRIDPGLAFGTGLHPTTRLCLAGLDSGLASGSIASLLDVGCGSGVLALAAARAGVGRVVAVDNDPEACRVTRENLLTNGLEGRVEVIEGGPAAAADEFELVLANILSGTLVDLRRELVARLAPAGRLVLSGILVEEADEVEAAFRQLGCRSLGRQVDDGWCAIALGAPERAT